jgi:hypothetical protein
MDKCYAREIVKADWNGQLNILKKKGEELVHDSQKEKAIEIYKAFLNGVSLVTLIASPQWGKTGVSLYLMYMMTTHTDDDTMTHPDNVFIITGMSDKDWRSQTKERMPNCFKNRVYHRNDLHKIIADVCNKRDILIIIDECHFGSETTQTLHNCLKTAGIWDINYMTENNVKILCISATPGNVLLDAQRWGYEHHHMVVAKDNGTSYTSFKTLLDQERILSTRDITKQNNITFIMDIINTKWKTPMYHIIRIHSKTEVFKAEIVKRGYTFSDHTSHDRILNVEELLSTEPKCHHFIFIKGFWRAAKTLNDKYIGICYESSKDYSSIAQGLGGRLLGYNRRTGSKAPILFCDVNAVKEYVNFLEKEANYLMCKKYKSNALTITKGQVTKKKDSVVHPNEIDNLLPVDEPNRLPTGVVRVKSHKTPTDAILTTKLEVLSISEFCKIYKVLSMPTDAKRLSAQLAQNGFNSNVSFKKQPASSVSNMVNYFKHKDWAHAKYHVIKLEGDNDVIVITRDTQRLNSLQPGDVFIAHNYKQERITYRYYSSE